MRPTNRPLLASTVTCAALWLLAATALPAQEPGEPHDHAARHAAMHGAGTGAAGTPHPAAPAALARAGSAVFETLEEAVGVLEADPETDWSRVDLDALRAHLLDMDALFVRAAATAEEISGGARFRVTGPPEALAAARRMVPAHAAAMGRSDDPRGWSWRAALEEASVVLEVTGPDAAAAARIRSLGFFGLMSSGGHHRVHHLAIARGDAGAHAH